MNSKISMIIILFCVIVGALSGIAVGGIASTQKAACIVVQKRTEGLKIILKLKAISSDSVIVRSKRLGEDFFGGISAAGEIDFAKFKGLENGDTVQLVTSYSFTGKECYWEYQPAGVNK